MLWAFRVILLYVYLKRGCTIHRLIMVASNFLGGNLTRLKSWTPDSLIQWHCLLLLSRLNCNAFGRQTVLDTKGWCLCKELISTTFAVNHYQSFFATEILPWPTYTLPLRKCICCLVLFVLSNETQRMLLLNLIPNRLIYHNFTGALFGGLRGLFTNLCPILDGVSLKAKICAFNPCMLVGLPSM